MKVVNTTTGEEKEIQPEVIYKDYDSDLEYLQEEVVSLAEDIIDHEEVLQMLWEKIQAVEDDQLQDVENLSNVVDILGCLQEAHKLVLDIIIKQNETINLLSKEVNKLYNGIIFLTIWSLVLTILTIVISLNVFF